MKRLQNTTILQFVLLLVGVLWFLVSLANGRQARQQPDYIPIPNGNMILRMRLPIPPSPQQEIILYKNGIVAQGDIEEMYRGKSDINYQLSGKILADIQGLQDTWCKRAPVIRGPFQDTRMYAIGFYCKGRNGVQVRIPSDQFPKALAPLLLQVYPYP